MWPCCARYFHKAAGINGLAQIAQDLGGQASRPFVRKAEAMVPLDPSVKPLVEGLSDLHENAPKWRLVINEQVEVDF